jgi:hypothetical protein
VKAKKVAKDAKCVMTAAASQIFMFYANLLSVEAKYVWNKIVKEHMESKPFVDPQGVSQSGPRGMSRIRSNTMSLTTLILCQIVFKFLI